MKISACSFCIQFFSCSSHLHVRQGSECAEQSHSFTRARRSTKHQGFVLCQPSVQQSLVANSVQGGNHHVRRGHLVGLHLNLRYLALPGLPLACDAHLSNSKQSNMTLMLTVITQYVMLLSKFFA